MELGLSGRVALVTGASKGLGLASARALASEGASVFISSRNAGRLAAARDEIRARGGDCHCLAGDMSDPGIPARLVAAAVERWGRIDVVVANSGGPRPGSTLALSDAEIHGAIEEVMLPAVRLVRGAAPHMRAARWGRFCCIASYGVALPLRALPLSNVARTALSSWVRTAAGELIGDGVTINLACPGPHATDRMKELGGSGPMGDPGRFGQVVAFLCSEAAAFITGTAVVVDGGATAAQG